MVLKKGWQWPVFIVGLLVLGVGSNIALLVVARSNPSFAVEEDYYQKALAWDEHQAQQAINRELGWRLHFELDTAAPIPGTLALVAQVRDRRGADLDGASLEVEAFPIARSSHRQKLRLEPAGPGRYRAELNVERPGRWEFRWVVEHGEQRYTLTRTRELEPR
ncbi:MAG: FixH family protein [Acidobacteriota bacterium]|nr:FixH family protein [Acidobacteriota bacterium]MDQ7086676.1 FixH family protein [Acidobacteriota bacterium]